MVSRLIVKASALLLVFLLLFTSIAALLALSSQDNGAPYGGLLPYSGAVSMFLSGSERRPEKLLGLPTALPAIQSLPSEPEAFGPTPFSYNVKVSSDYESPWENEPSIAVNPLDPNNIVVAAHHETLSIPFVAVGVYYSTDGGETWSGPFIMPLYDEDDDFLQADPAVAVDGEGNFYVSYLSVGFRSVDFRFVFTSTVMLARSTDGGASWSVAPAVTPDYINIEELVDNGFFVNTALLDKQYLAAGPFPGDPSRSLLVITYTEFLSGFDVNVGDYVDRITIMASVSTDGGETWSTPTPVSPTITVLSADPRPRIVHGAYPAVGPDGTIYVAYYDSWDGWLEGSARIMFVKSEDGGITWSEPVVAAVIPYELTYYYTAETGDRLFRWWSSMFPSIAVGPDGAIYIAYAADPDGPGGDPGDVFLVVSTDGGETWSPPIRVNDDSPGHAQFFPWVTVGPDGIAHIIWGDTRHSLQGLGYDVYHAAYVNGTLTPNHRVTDYTSDATFAFGFIGDYFNAAAVEGDVYVVWTDLRRAVQRLPGPLPLLSLGGSDIFLARIGERPEPVGTADPSTLSAGRGRVVEFSFEGLPRYATFVATLNGTLASPLISSIIVSSDAQGRASLTILMPGLEEGVYSLELRDLGSGIVYAAASITVVDVVAQRVSDLSSAVEGLAERVDSVDSRVGEVDAAIGELSAMVSSLGAEVSTLMDSLAAIEGRVDSLEDAVASVREELALAEDRIVAGLSERIEGLEADLESLGDRVTMLEEGQRAQGEAIASISRAIDELDSSIRGLEEGFGERLSSLEEGLSRALEEASASSRNSAINMALSLITLIALAGLAGLFYRTYHSPRGS